MFTFNLTSLEQNVVSIKVSNGSNHVLSTINMSTTNSRFYYIILCYYYFIYLIYFKTSQPSFLPKPVKPVFRPQMWHHYPDIYIWLNISLIPNLRSVFSSSTLLWSVGLHSVAHLSVCIMYVCISPRYPIIIGCDKSCDIRMIEILICLESSHCLNLDVIISRSQIQLFHQV